MPSTFTVRNKDVDRHGDSEGMDLGGMLTAPVPGLYWVDQGVAARSADVKKTLRVTMRYVKRRRPESPGSERLASSERSTAPAWGMLRYFQRPWNSRVKLNHP